MDELEKAHLDYEKRKNELVSKLTAIMMDNNLRLTKKVWIKQAIDFIREREI